MARLSAHRSLCQNLPPAGEDKLTNVLLTKSSGTVIPTPVVSRAPTLAPATAPAATLSSDKELFKQFIKAYLEAQVLGQTKVDSESYKQPLTARFPDFYYVNSHMDCYQFYQQCKDHFETAGAKRLNKIPFAASFLRGSIT